MKELFKNIIALFAVLGPFVSIICFVLDLYEASAISAFLGAIGIWGLIINAANNVSNTKGNGFNQFYD